MSASEKPWTVVRSNPEDQPPEHHPDKPWCVLHPRVHQHRARQISRFATHEEALAFLLAQPEYRRKTSRTAAVLQRIDDALNPDPYARSADA